MIYGAEQSIPFHGPGDVKIPKSMDWRGKGAVTAVKDQGYCGSCWSFSTTGSLESHYFIKTGHLLSLSEQSLVDCSKSYSNNGCNGGWPDKGIEYVRDHGIQSEVAYPYHASEGICQSNTNRILANNTVHGFSLIPSGNEEELQKALAVHGPISVLFDASHPSFQHYSSGVWHEPTCGSDIYHLTHAVLLGGRKTLEFDK